MNISWTGNEEKKKKQKQYTLKFTIEELIRLEEAVKTSLKFADDMYMFYQKQAFAEELNSKQQKYARQRLEEYTKDIEVLKDILKKLEEAK